MKFSFATLFLCIALPVVIDAQPLPQLASGTLRRFESFPTLLISPRNVDVWLPEHYTSAKRYSVLYMHDGQMLFDAATTWNKSAWDVDDVAGNLLAKGKIKDFIIVGIWNNGATRHSDYFPQKIFESLSKKDQEMLMDASRSNGASVFGATPVCADAYLKFITTELKPFIDKNFSTLPDRDNTFIAGSSMGGLISCYAICEYPEVFGGAACLSTHWPGIFRLEDNPVPKAMYAYLKKNLPNPRTHRLYFDYGDQTLDALYPTLQTKVDKILKKKRYNANNWTTRYFPGADHSERAWNQRFDGVLLFLLGK